MALIASGIGETQILVLQPIFPAIVLYLLKLLDVEHLGNAVAYRAHYLSILNRSLRVDIHTTEHLHVDVAKYDFKNISATSPSGENIGFLP